MRHSLEKPEPLHLLNGKPTHCHWCRGLLKGLRDSYNGKNGERYYCSQECFREGEERAAQYAIAGSRLQSHWYVAVAGMLAVLMIAFASTPKGRAQDQAEHEQAGYRHPYQKDFYSKWCWTQPRGIIYFKPPDTGG